MTSYLTYKRLQKLTCTLTIAGQAVSSSVLASPPPPTAAPTVAITIVDDTSGGGARGVLDANTAPQLQGLLNLAGAAHLKLSYWLIQEAVAEPVSATLPVWQPTKPIPERPSKNLPYQQYLKASRDYEAAMHAYWKDVNGWKEGTVRAFEGFLQAAAEARYDLDDRWLEKLHRGAGRDFPRSAIAATLPAAAQSDAAAQSRFLIAATDGRDLPGNGKPGRTAPLTAKDIPDEVKIIFICADGKPPTAPLLSSLASRSQTRIARDLKEAAALVVATLEEERSANATAAAR